MNRPSWLEQMRHSSTPLDSMALGSVMPGSPKVAPDAATLALSAVFIAPSARTIGHPVGDMRPESVKSVDERKSDPRHEETFEGHFRAATLPSLAPARGGGVLPCLNRCKAALPRHTTTLGR